MIGLLVAVIVGGIICRQIYYYLGVKASAIQSTSIRLRIFGHLLRRRIYDDEKPLHSGDVTSRLETDVSAISDAVAGTLPQLVVTTVKLVGAFLLLYSMDRQLAWMLLLSTPLLVVMGKLFARRLRSMTHDVREQDSRIQMLVQEGMEHNAMLRAMESGSWLTGQLGTMQQGLLSKIERRTRFTLVARSVMAVCFGFGYLLAFIWGGLQLRDGIITFGVMTAFLQLVAQIQQPILDMLNMIPQLIHASASIDRLEELEQKDAEGDQQPAHVLAGTPGVHVEGVTFRYPNGRRFILKMLSLLQTQEGSIQLYNDAERVPLTVETRRNFIFVPQGNTLMSGSIRYNLQLANPHATDEEMRHVLHVAVADFVFDLPDGLDTSCGERGVGFSEGQAQRIAIARGLLRPGHVLLLDEISASLDEQTERELFTRLFQNYGDMTIIMITHRSTVAQLCDETVSLKRL